MSLVENKYVFAIVGEIAVCTESALREGESEAVGKTVFVAKKAPDKAKYLVEMSHINVAVLTHAADAERVITVLHEVVEGFEDLGGFKRISANIGNTNTTFTLDVSSLTDEPKRVVLKVVMLFEKRAG
jgi:hypothetical protein